MGIGALVIVVGMAVGVATLRRSPHASTDPLAAARARALEAAEGLEIFTIEYPQAAQGAELAGALGALSRARHAFGSAQEGLARIDATTTQGLAAAFATLEREAAARAPANHLLPLADQMRRQLLALAGRDR